MPEYTLVSGLPSYEAALELLHKTPKSCLIVHPSVFEVFNKNEKLSSSSIEGNASTSAEVSEPLLTDHLKLHLPSYAEAFVSPTTTPTSLDLSKNHSFASLLSVAQMKSLPKSKSSNSTTTANPSPTPSPTSEAEKMFKS